MKIISGTFYISLLVILIIGLFIAGAKAEGRSKHNITQTLSIVGDMDPTLNGSLEYTNPYYDNTTIKTFVENEINIIFYATMRGINNAIGATINLGWDFFTFNKMLTLIKLLLTMIGITILSKLIQPTAVVYLWIEDYCYKTNKKWSRARILLSSILIIIGSSSLVVALIVWGAL